jgi:uncharacterized membrane protein
MYRLATESAEEVHWILRRNCSVSPRQLGGMFVLLCVLSLTVAGFFWSQGAWMVLPFSALELLAAGTAFLVYARHATDGETIRLRNGRLVVEVEEAGRLHRVEFAGRGVRIEPPTARERLILVCCNGQTMQVGRFVRPDMRPVLAHELRRALKGV